MTVKPETTFWKSVKTLLDDGNYIVSRLESYVTPGFPDCLIYHKNTGFFILDYDDSIDYFKKYSNDELTNLALNDKEGYNQDCHKLADEVESTIEYVFLFDSYRIHSGMPRNDDTRVSIDIRINPVDKFVHGFVGSGKQKAEVTFEK